MTKFLKENKLIVQEENGFRKNAQLPGPSSYTIVCY